MRDDFTPQTRDVLARRVGMRCSNPECAQQTSGPRYDPQKAVNIGVAAHITAASRDGPRFDASLTSEQRKSVDNGIWLCQNCAKLVDNDQHRFTVAMLREWKETAEEAARKAVTEPAKRDADSANVHARALIQDPNAIRISRPNAVQLGPNAIKIVQSVERRPDQTPGKETRSDALSQFITEAQQLRARADEEPLPVADHNAWVERVSAYLRTHLNRAYDVRFGDFSGMVFYGDGSERSQFLRSLEGRTRRLHEFLQELPVRESQDTG